MTREVNRLCNTILPDKNHSESLDLEATEMSVRHSMHNVGAVFLEKLANVDLMEAGCKTIVGQRLKLSGMRWTVKGANAIISLRTCQQSGQWEDYWESRKAA